MLHGWTHIEFESENEKNQASSSCSQLKYDNEIASYSTEVPESAMTRRFPWLWRFLASHCAMDIRPGSFELWVVDVSTHLWPQTMEMTNVHIKFMKGHFVIQKGSHKDSILAHDQVQEQLNPVKCDGRIIGLPLRDGWSLDLRLQRCCQNIRIYSARRGHHLVNIMNSVWHRTALLQECKEHCEVHQGKRKSFQRGQQGFAHEVY